MRIDEFTEEPIFEARMVWRKIGNKIIRAVRCTSGRRKGRVVKTAGQCNKPIDFKKRLTIKKNKAKFGARMARRAQRTKRFNIKSKQVRALNRRR